MQEYPSIKKNEINDFFRDFIKFFINFFLFILQSIKRYLLLFIIILIGVYSVFYFYNKNAPSYYSSQMVCTFNYLHKKTFGELVYRLNTLAVTQSYDELAATLDIPIESAEKIIGLEARNVAGSPLHEDITEAQLPMYFTAKVSEKEVFPLLEKALVDYLNNAIPYHLRRAKLELQRYSEKIDFLNSTLSQVDSLIDAYILNMRFLSNKKDSITELDGMVQLFRLKEELKDKKLSDQKMIQLQMAVEILYGFAPTEHPNVHLGISKVKILIYVLLLGIAIVVFLNLIRGHKT